MYVCGWGASGFLELENIKPTLFSYASNFFSNPNPKKFYFAGMSYFVFVFTYIPHIMAGST